MAPRRRRLPTRGFWIRCEYCWRQSRTSAVVLWPIQFSSSFGLFREGLFDRCPDGTDGRACEGSRERGTVFFIYGGILRASSARSKARADRKISPQEWRQG